MTNLRTLVALLACLWTLATAVRAQIGLEARAGAVGRYESLEFLLTCGPDATEPVLEVTAPSGRHSVVSAFLSQPYERRRVPRDGREADWCYPVGEPQWLARFAPVEVGEHVAVARQGAGGDGPRSAPVRFTSLPSEHHGYVGVCARDPRFLAYADGTPFFAIGQNLAFVGESQHFDLTGAEGALGRLAESGANLVRLWACCGDWGLAIEAPKSAWGRSWAASEALAEAPGEPGRKCVRLAGERGATVAMDPSHPVALRPSTRYRLSGRLRTDGPRLAWDADPSWEIAGVRGEWCEFAVEFETSPERFWLGRTQFRLTEPGEAWLDRLTLTEARGGPNLLWEADPNRPERGAYNPLDCFLLDQLVAAAERSGITLMVCLLARDLYMGDLVDEASDEYTSAIADATRLLRHASARWGASPAVAMWEFWNEMDPGRPTERLHREVRAALASERSRPTLLTTSDWSPCPRDWADPSLDVACEHYYLRPSERERVRDEVDAVLQRTGAIRAVASRKPALLAEFGLATDEWGLSDSMLADADLVHFHNVLWASALSGLSGTAMFWWWEELDRRHAEAHYRPLADFLRGIAFASGTVERASAAVSDPRVRVIGLTDESGFHGWLLAEAATWARIESDGPPKEEVDGARLVVEDLPAGPYRVTWYDTRTGAAIESSEAASDGQACETGIPPIRTDLACHIVRRD